MGARRGAKTRDEAQSRGAAGPSFERLSPLSVPPARSRARDAVYMRAAYALRGFAECIREYRVHRDSKDESAIVRAGDVERRNRRGIEEESLDKNIRIDIFLTRTCDPLKMSACPPL